MQYAVSCMEDLDCDGNARRVLATTRRFPTAAKALAYAVTIDASRQAEIHSCCPYCGEWREIEGDRGWPECAGCGAI